MENKNQNRVCPVNNAGSLDNSIRKLIQNPQKIVKPFIKNGMSVLDVGCGPGFFSIEIAKMLNGTGKVIAVDLQEGMLDKVRKKIKGTNLESKIELHKCQNQAIGISEKVDFILAFYMVHEVPNQDMLFKEMNSLLKPNGRILIAEPKFHVSAKSFIIMEERVKKYGFKTIDKPKIVFSRTLVLEKEESC
jgi:ubiquinone/menaquinone biosynthesis C-methylase UbiE